MKNNSLEDRIIKKVYRMETKLTFWYLASRIIFFSLAASLILIMISVLLDIFKEQGTFDLLNFWGDDREVLGMYLMDNIGIFISETPLELLIILLLGASGFIYLTYKVIGNYGKIRNKLVSIYKFYSEKL